MNGHVRELLECDVHPCPETLSHIFGLGKVKEKDFSACELNFSARGVCSAGFPWRRMEEA